MVEDNESLIQLLRINEDLSRILDGATNSRKFNLDSEEKRLMAAFLAKACKTYSAVVLLATSIIIENKTVKTLKPTCF